MSANTEQAAPETRGRAIMVSYEELLKFRLELEAIKGMLHAALAIGGTVDEHERRIAALEREDARLDGSRGAWRMAIAYVGGGVSAIIGGGALQYLPNILGWH